MIPLRKKVNAIQPAGAFQNGDLKDNPGDGSGVPVDRNLLDDQAQFFESMMEIGELYALAPGAAINASAGYSNAFTGRNYVNPEIDNGSTIFQLLSAFFLAIGIRIQSFIATQAQVNAGNDNISYVTANTLKGFFQVARSSYYPTTTVTGGTGTFTNNAFYYKIDGNRIYMNCNIAVTFSGGVSAFTVSLPPGFKKTSDYNYKIIVHLHDTGVPFGCQLELDANQTAITISPLASTFPTPINPIVFGFDICTEVVPV